jgi:hypothetical protein
MQPPADLGSAADLNCAVPPLPVRRLELAGKPAVGTLMADQRSVTFTPCRALPFPTLSTTVTVVEQVKLVEPLGIKADGAVMLTNI